MIPAIELNVVHGRDVNGFVGRVAFCRYSKEATAAGFAFAAALLLEQADQRADKSQEESLTVLEARFLKALMSEMSAEGRNTTNVPAYIRRSKSKGAQGPMTLVKRLISGR